MAHPLREVFRTLDNKKHINCFSRRKHMAPSKNSKFMKPMKVSEELAAVVGRGPMPRTEVTKKLWAYIKSRKLQDPKNKRNIIVDEKLEKVLGKKKFVNMFDMTKLVNAHLS